MKHNIMRNQETEKTSGQSTKRIRRDEIVHSCSFRLWSLCVSFVPCLKICAVCRAICHSVIELIIIVTHSDTDTNQTYCCMHVVTFALYAFKELLFIFQTDLRCLYLYTLSTSQQAEDGGEQRSGRRQEGAGEEAADRDCQLVLPRQGG